MDGKTTATALLGLSLLGAHFLVSEDGRIVRDAISNTSGSVPTTAQAHTALVRTGGLLVGVVIATIAASASDNAGNLFIAFFVLLWVIFGFKNADKLPQLGGSGKALPGSAGPTSRSYSATQSGVGTSHNLRSI